jgi:hypothetical protein
VRPVLIAGVVLAGCAVGSALRPAHSQPPDRLPDLTPAAPGAGAPASDPHVPYGVGQTKFAHRAATSCAASSCHGGGQVGKVGSEHTTWAPEAFPHGASDPHSKAYRVLFNPVSTEMAKKLKLGEAHTAALCLKCHAVETTNDPESRGQVLAEGVGCSACHGAAEKWIGEHYTAGWKSLSNREKWDKYGFVPTKNLVARTLNCATCHVGDADHDLNHDLYAAGHPRITFEAARMHHQPDYRKHWTEKTPQPDFEVRLWIVGQFATLRSAADLLRSRAEKAGKPGGNWPEFAGYSCYSCHQRVGEGDLRGGMSDAGTIQADGKPLLRQVGVPGWEVWSTTAIDVAAEYCKDAYPGLRLGTQNLSAVRKLRQTMGADRTPAAADVAKDARAAVAELDRWLAELQAADDSGANLKPVRAGLAAELAIVLANNAFTDPKAAKGATRLKDHDWDALAANYLGCAAMFHAQGGTAGGNNWFAELDDVRKGLRFPPRTAREPLPTSPIDYDGTKINKLREQFELLRDAAGTPGGKR